MGERERRRRVPLSGVILEWASANEAVLPGAVLGSGTVAGRCGFDLDRRVDYGDRVELEVERLATLSHRLVESWPA